MKKIFLLFLLFLVTCSEDVYYAAGKEDEVFVVADSGVWKELKNLIKESLYKDVRIVHEKPIFTVKYAEPQNFRLKQKRKNLLLIGSGTSDRTFEFIRNILPSNALSKIESQGAGIFLAENFYAEGQIVVVIGAKDMTSLKDILKKKQDTLFNIFQGKIKERIKTKTLKQFNERLSKRMRNQYGWSLKLPRQYFVSRDLDRFVRFIRRHPDRFISIYWEFTDNFDAQYCLDERKIIAKIYYRGDQIDTTRTKIEGFKFRGRDIFVISGVWQNEQYVMGGPFLTYCIYEPKKKTAYFVDGLIFAPGKNKWVYLCELEAIIESFELN